MSQVGIFSSSLATRSIDLAIKRFAKTPWTLKHKSVCSWLDAICIEYINEALTGAFSTIFVTFTFVLETPVTRVVTLNHILAIESFVFAICWYLEDRETERLGDKTLAWFEGNSQEYWTEEMSLCTNNFSRHEWFQWPLLQIRIRFDFYMGIPRESKLTNG